MSDLKTDTFRIIFLPSGVLKDNQNEATNRCHYINQLDRDSGYLCAVSKRHADDALRVAEGVESVYYA